MTRVKNSQFIIKRNESHTLAYSLIALQEMNLYHHYPGIFWDCACLINDSGGSEETDNEGKSANYDKIAAAIGKMRSAGVQIALPHINKSSYTFVPDVEENKIIFATNRKYPLPSCIGSYTLQKKPVFRIAYSCDNHS